MKPLLVVAAHSFDNNYINGIDDTGQKEDSSDDNGKDHSDLVVVLIVVVGHVD